MALNFNIPLPGLPGDALLSGFKTGGNLFTQFMHPKLEREKQEQLERHFQEQLKLSKAAAGRAAQSAMDAHKLALQKLDPTFEARQMDAVMDYFRNKNKAAGQAFGVPGINIAQEDMSAPTEEAGQGLGMFSPEGLGDRQQDIGAMQKAEAPQTARLSLPGNPSNADLELMKQFPALRGWYKQHYKIDPLAETPEQKVQNKVNTAMSINEAKSTQKKIDEIEKTAQALLPYIGKVNTIGDILERKPNLTGPLTKFADMLGMSKDEDIGRMLSASQALQAHLAKDLSSRGGYGVSKLVEQAKPNIGKSTAYNKGVIKELRQGMKDSFDQMKSEYERISHKKFPYNFEQYFQEQTGNSSNNANTKRLKYNSVTGRLE